MVHDLPVMYKAMFCESKPSPVNGNRLNRLLSSHPKGFFAIPLGHWLWLWLWRVLLAGDEFPGYGGHLHHTVPSLLTSSSVLPHISSAEDCSNFFHFGTEFSTELLFANAPMSFLEIFNTPGKFFRFGIW